MSKKLGLVICVIVSGIILCGITLVGVYFYEKNDGYEWPYEVNVGLCTDVTWDITDNIPDYLPVYTVQAAADTSYVWRNIIAFCGFQDNIVYAKNASFSTQDWRISINEDDEIRCCYNDRKFDPDTITHVDYLKLNELAWEFLERLGVRTENYYISGYPVDPEGIYRIIEFSYKLGDYEAEEWPTVISISYVEDMITDLTIHCEDITEYGSVSIISLDEIKEQFKNMSFYTSSPILSKMDVLENLRISDIVITYVHEDNMLVPYVSLAGEMYDEPIFGDVTSSQIKAYDGTIKKKSSESFSEDESQADEELVINKITDFYKSGKSSFTDRKFEAASFILYDVYFEINNMTEVTTDLLWIKYKSLLYAVLADLFLDKTSEILSPLIRCDEYFEMVSHENHDWIDKTELQTARVFTKVALAHRYTELHEHETAGTYLVSAKKLIDEIPGNKYQELFYQYVMTMLSPQEADDLVECIAEWREMCYGGESKNYRYYAPIMKVLGAKAFCKSGEFEKADALFGELLHQGIRYGNNEIEEMRLKAEIFAAYAEFLTSNETDADDGDALQYLLDVASLYNSLRMIHDDGVTLDGTYFKHSGTSYYVIAVFYANQGQPETALSYLEASLVYLEQFPSESSAALRNALDLGVVLCEYVGDSKMAAQYSEKMKYFEELFSLTRKNADNARVIAPDASFLALSGSDIAIVKKMNISNSAGLPIESVGLSTTQKDASDPRLVQAVEMLNREIDSILKEYSNGLTMNYLHCVAHGYLTMHELMTNLSVVRADEKVISVLLEVNWNTNGPHPIDIHHAFNYSMREGRIITEDELIRPEMAETINTMLHQKYPKTIIFDVREGPDNNYEVALAPDGILFVFSPGRAGAYVDGTLTLLYPYEDESEYKMEIPVM